MAPTMRLLAALAMVLSLTIVEATQRYAAQPVLPDALLPRYFIDKSIPIAKRRIGNCKEDQHPCEETGFGDQCCPNDNYCYVNKEGKPRCCPIGSNCPNDSYCSSDAYFCTETTSQSGTASTREGCCHRRCPATSQYLCAPDDGGNCCSYDAECRADRCVETKKPSSSAQLTPVEEGCTTSQYRCPDGKGCCDNDRSCTMDKGTAVCAPGRPTETDLDYISDDSSSGGGLSDGAKAGIGVGAVVGAAIIIGGLAWLCIHKRRERRRTATQPSGGSNQQHEEAAVATEVSHSSRPPQAGHGLTRDYFGPNPAAGPYTETSGHHSIAASSPGPYRAVPSRPEQPGDIAAPVEIDSARSEYSPMSSPSFQGSPQPQQPSTIDGRFELYGSTDTEPLPRSPSTMPTAVAHQARQEDRG